MAESTASAGPVSASVLAQLHNLARLMGVATNYRDGLGNHVTVGPDTIVAVCASLGAEVSDSGDAASALRAEQARRDNELVPPVMVAWDGHLRCEVPGSPTQFVHAELMMETGEKVSAEGEAITADGRASAIEFHQVPPGYHRLRVEIGTRTATSTVIAAPEQSWHRPNSGRSWGIAAHLAALRTHRSRSVGDLADLTILADGVRSAGGDLVSLLPLLPTFNNQPTEPSPYSPVSRLFWSELMLDLGAAHRPAKVDEFLDVEQADAEVRLALRDAARPDAVSDELARYARFRGAQKKLGRSWRQWPGPQRNGSLDDEDVDRDEERFHLVAQTEVDHQLSRLGKQLHDTGVGLGLDLAVGVHPDGYDAWSRADLFAVDMSVGAPPDGAFPSGQDWGFPPILPGQSQSDGHRYFAAGVAHQAAIAGVLRIDHIMAATRLYWIPDGRSVAEGTYVQYPSDELFAVLCLESHRNHCELVGENLGTVPPDIEVALPRHQIHGMYLVQFQAGATSMPSADELAMIGTHDTPTFAGWLEGADVDERVALGLLPEAKSADERARRRSTVEALARRLGGRADDPEELLGLTIDLLGASPSPLVVLWLEDLWLETRAVNVPGTSSSQRPNWRRTIGRSIDTALSDPQIVSRLERLDTARRGL